MKIYCNGKLPKMDKKGNWINFSKETKDEYTLIHVFGPGAIDVRKNEHGDVAIYLPHDQKAV